MNIEEFKSLLTRNTVLVKYDDFEIELISFVGKGSYNTVFMGKYKYGGVEKYSIIKFFLPDFIDEVKIDYNFEVSENNTLLDHIYLTIRAQNAKYIGALNEYKISNEEMISLLNNIAVNSFVPTPFNERAMSVKVSSNNAEMLDIINCVMCFEYSLKTDLNTYLSSCAALPERIRVVRCITSVLNKLYKSGSKLIMLDLKIDNFLFKSNGDEGLDNLYIIDWDSLVRLNSSGRVVGDVKIRSSEGVCPREISDGNRRLIGVKSCIYMLGVALFQALFQPYISQNMVKSICEIADEFNGVKFNDDIVAAFNKMKVTHGFIVKFSEIMSKSYNLHIASRYQNNDESNVFEQFLDDINTLLDIYTNKGVHPEVMLDSANELVKSEDFNKSLNGFKRELLCDMYQA